MARLASSHVCRQQEEFMRLPLAFAALLAIGMITPAVAQHPQTEATPPSSSAQGQEPTQAETPPHDQGYTVQTPPLCLQGACGSEAPAEPTTTPSTDGQQ
jgi:hypothetical protein